MADFNSCASVFAIHYLVSPPGSDTYQFISISSGSLPTGISQIAELDGYTRTPGVQGTCNIPGTYSFTLLYRKVVGLEDVYFPVVLTINDRPKLDISSIPPIDLNKPYYHVLRVLSDKDPSSFAVTLSGDLPTGISFNSIIGSPALIGETAESGRYPVTFTVIDNDTSCYSVYDFVFNVNSIQLNVTLPCTKPGIPYSFFLRPSGGLYPYRYHIRAGYTLPSDIVLDSYTGELRGSVYAEGMYILGLRIFDGSNNYIDEDISLICSKECSSNSINWLPSMQSKPAVVGESYLGKNLIKFLPSIFEV